MPFLERIPPRKVLWVILAITFFSMSGVWLQFLPLEDTMKAGGGYGIVDYELAFTPQKANEIFGTWGSDAFAAARQSLLIDYAFMPSYGLFFAAVTLLLARAQLGAMRSIGFALTLGSLVAALFDALENAMLLMILPAPPVISAVPPMIAGIAASIKFLLLVLALIYWLVSLIRLIMTRFSPQSV